MRQDISHQVMISLRASEAWVAMAEKVMAAIPPSVLANSELAIEDEAIWLRGSELVIEAAVLGETVRLLVPASDWQWIA